MRAYYTNKYNRRTVEDSMMLSVKSITDKKFNGIIFKGYFISRNFLLSPTDLSKYPQLFVILKFYGMLE